MLMKIDCDGQLQQLWKLFDVLFLIVQKTKVDCQRVFGDCAGQMISVTTVL
jgi:hypothetical protein